MLQRTGAEIAPQTHQRPADRGRLAPAYSGRRANPRLTWLLSDLALDASCPGHQSWAQSFDQLAA